MQGNSNPLRVRVERGIYKRTTRDGKTTRYEVAFVDSDGRQRWRTCERLQEARDLRAELVSKVKRGERVAPAKVTLAEYCEQWLVRQEPRLRARTHEGYSTNLRQHVRPRLGRRQLQSITVDDVADVIAGMEKGERFVERDGRLVMVTGRPFNAWTIRGVLKVLSRVLGSAARAGLIHANVVGQLERGERPRVEKRELPALDHDAIRRLIGKTPKRYRTLVAVSVLTGLRQGEALGLRWQDVDVKAGVLHVRVQLDRQGNLVEPKTAAAKRDVPIDPALGRLLTEHRLASRFSGDDNFVFCTETGGPGHRRNAARRGLDKATEAAGLPHLRWHDLRHLAASWMISEGASDDELCRTLGHANAAITKTIYAHEFERVERVDRMRERMAVASGRVLG